MVELCLARIVWLPDITGCWYGSLEDVNVQVADLLGEVAGGCFLALTALALFLVRPLRHLVRWIARVLYYPLVIMLCVFVPATILTGLAEMLATLGSFMMAPVGIKPEFVVMGVGSLATPVFWFTALLAVAFWITSRLKKMSIPKKPPRRYTLFEAEQLRAAYARVALHHRDGVHMCLKFGCPTPVIGEKFAHCKRHLDWFELRWLTISELASTDGIAHDSESAIANISRRSAGYLGDRYARRNAKSKDRALKRARSLLDRSRRRGNVVPEFPTNSLPTS
jgi:hypothetical protein